jgi:hypothetical protein
MLTFALLSLRVHYRYAVPVAPGRCRLLNRNTFKFSKGGGIARALMRLAPGWAIHIGTQVMRGRGGGWGAVLTGYAMNRGL